MGQATKAGLVGALLLGTGAAHADAPRHVLELGDARIDLEEGSFASEKLADQNAQVKKPGAGKPDEITLRGGAAMARGLAKLFDDGLGPDCLQRVEGNFVFANDGYAEVARVAFSWAAITDVTLPALDAASKDPASLLVKLHPEYPRNLQPHGGGAKPAAGPAWSRGTFKLAIGGADVKGAKAVGELKITQTPSVGAPVKCGAASVSDLTFAASPGDPAIAAWKDAKPVTIEYLAADGTPVLKAKLSGVKKKSEKTEGGALRVVASVESVSFKR